MSALPAILTPAPGSDAARSLAAFHKSTTLALQHNAEMLSARLREVPGLRVIAPQVSRGDPELGWTTVVQTPRRRLSVQGAMYLMVGFSPTPAIPSDVEFSQLLLREENVSVLPGTVRTSSRFESVEPFPSPCRQGLHL